MVPSLSGKCLKYFCFKTFLIASTEEVPFPVYILAFSIINRLDAVLFYGYFKIIDIHEITLVHIQWYIY